MSLNPTFPGGLPPKNAAALPDAGGTQKPAEPSFPRKGSSPPGRDEAKPGPEAHKTVAPSYSRPCLVENWFLRNEGPHKHANVHFPMRPDVEVMPLICGQTFFRALAEEIASAQRSVDLVSWGLDTDMVLIRSDGAADYGMAFLLIQSFKHVKIQRKKILKY
jgi:phosphatidylserine/phosphatidylglycerophosphate/cardiolipin synthase-like enzyme